ncbi:hypothetical protein B0T25DRAFT_280266 [Lasiosphaeria hispida]|uniref:AA1-like domain-containing protein n=1 Tax=Lasiosphaeria hispida TaxID=260671 RepID=A0AAJ0HBI0_9PEZI|nr:hypothetical protein B0T25DRAFT_280266 [Lasiosphaeria hispida]
MRGYFAHQPDLSISLFCPDPLTQYIPHRIAAQPPTMALFLLLSLAPLTSALPATTDCATSSLALKTLTLTTTQITRGSPFQNENTTVAFHLANPATGAAARCAASSTALTPNGLASDPYRWYECATEGAGTAEAATQVAATGTRFQYDGTLHFLTVNSSWVCLEAESGKPILFAASGWNALPLDWCVEDGAFARTCKQGKDGKVDFEVDVTVKRFR